MEHEILTDYHNKISLRVKKIENDLFTKLHLTPEQYIKLIGSEEGRKKIEAVINSKPEVGPLLLKLDMTIKFHLIIDEEYNSYLPF